MSTPNASQGLTAAVKREIAAVARRSPGAQKSWQAELSLKLAREIETGDDVLASRVSAAKVLASTMDSLRRSAPAEKKVDRLDEIGARRTARKARAS